MKITQVKLGRISTPLRVPFKTALRTVRSVEEMCIRDRVMGEDKWRKYVRLYRPDGTEEKF